MSCSAQRPVAPSCRLARTAGWLGYFPCTTSARAVQTAAEYVEASHGCTSGRSVSNRFPHERRLSEEPGGPKSDQAAGEMEKRQRVLRLFLPPNEVGDKRLSQEWTRSTIQRRAKTASFAFDGLGLFPKHSHMGRKAEFQQGCIHLIIVVSLVKAHPLWMLLCWPGTLDDVK